MSDMLGKIYKALNEADIEYSALSTTGINIFGDRKSIDAVSSALNRSSQLDGVCTNLRHWQGECGKLHAKLAQILEVAEKADAGKAGIALEQIAHIANAKASA